MKDAERSQVSVDLIDPNPHRDFDLSPLDDTRVARLVESYKTNGDFGVLSLRLHPDTKGRYQLAGGGHHRLEAIKKSSRKYADVKVAKFDDDAMLNALIDENAGQDDTRFCVVIEAVGAILIQEVCRLLLSKNIENKSNRKSMDYLFAGRGVGAPTIIKHIKGRFSESQVREAIASIKDSDIHLRLTNRAFERIVALNPDKTSEPHLRAKKVLAAVSKIEPTLSSEVLSKLTKPSHVKALREGVKKRGTDLTKQRGMLDAIFKNDQTTANDLEDAFEDFDDEEVETPADKMLAAKAAVAQAADQFFTAVQKQCDLDPNVRNPINFYAVILQEFTNRIKK